MTTIPVETQIVAVTVYPTQARVTRQGTVQLAQGDATLELIDLPATLQPQTVQAQGHSSKATLQTVEVIPIPDLAPHSDAIHEATETLRNLEDQFRQAKDHLAALGLKRTFLEALSERSSRTFSLGLAQQQIDLSRVTDLLTYLEAQYQTLAEAIAQQERHKQDLDQQLQRARHNHQVLQSALPNICYRVCIPLHMATTGPLTIEVTYQVEQAQWHPCYDIRFGKTPDRLKLDYFANVCQQTGEDWSDVPIRLSTATPEKSPMLPEPNAWYIDVSRKLPKSPAHKPSGRTRSPILNDTYRMLGALPGSELPPLTGELEPREQTFASAIAVVQLKALHTATILSDSKVQRVPVARCEFASQLTYVALPQRCDAAYLQAHLTNPADGLPLLPGTAQLFRDGGYIGQERFDYVAPSQSFELSLGLDERLSVQRELVQRHITDASNNQVQLAYRLNLYNPLTHSVQITVLEQIPVSRNEEVKVNLEVSKPPVTQSNAGICQWDLTLEGRATAHIEYQYQVNYPCGTALTGLEM
ncbi:MAG: mucoidy inhibitor MuiA family protein [Leptolyngbyaceae cyanobacterium]